VVSFPQMFLYRLKSKQFGALFFWIAFLAVPMVHAVTIGPENPNIQYHGRWNFDSPALPWVTWQGSSMVVKFDGTKITGDFNPVGSTKQYRVIVDGIPNPNRLYMTTGLSSYTLADNLAAGEHTVEVLQETFTGQKTTFHGFDITGTILTPPSRPSLRIEYFGDSNMDGTSLYSENNSGDSGTYYAFPAMVTRMLGAEMNLQALGGATIEQNGDNNVGDFIFSEDYHTQDTGYRSGFDPHIIVINAGANDIYGANKATIKQRYKNVIADLRMVYGASPHIVLMNAYGWDVNEPANYTQEVVNEVGDSNLSAFHYPWLWEQWHGSQWDHSGESHLLLDHLASINPAWISVNSSDIADGFGRDGNFANGSFEHAAPFGGYGWRYYTDGVERINDSVNAAEGNYFLRLDVGELVHQPTDATADFLPGGTDGGETYTIVASMRGTAPGAQAQIITEFQGQEIWTRGNAQTATFNLSTEWEDYTAEATADAGIWTLFNTLKATIGTVDIDHVRMMNPIDEEAPPAGCSNNAGGSFEQYDSFCITVPGVEAGSSFVWMKDGVPLSDDSRISGSQTRTLLFDALNISDSGAYSCQYDDGTRTASIFGPVQVNVVVDLPITSKAFFVLLLIIVNILATFFVLLKTPSKK